MDILKLRDPSTGDWIPIPAIKGDTPVKGVDYFTQQEKEELIAEIEAEVSDTSELATKTELQAVRNAIPARTSELTNDSDFVVSSALGGYATKTALNDYAKKDVLENYATNTSLNQVAADRIPDALVATETIPSVNNSINWQYH